MFVYSFQISSNSGTVCYVPITMYSRKLHALFCHKTVTVFWRQALNSTCATYSQPLKAKSRAESTAQLGPYTWVWVAKNFVTQNGLILPLKASWKFDLVIQQPKYFKSEFQKKHLAFSSQHNFFFQFLNLISSICQYFLPLLHTAIQTYLNFWIGFY